MNEPLSLLTAWLLGFIGSIHCMGMCGGIVGALTLNNQSKHPVITQLAYHAGRISTYGLLGLTVGFLGFWLADLHHSLANTMRVISGGMLILMGLYVSGATQALNWLEKGGSVAWKYIQPISKTFLPVRNLPQAMGLGMVWGLLPCGLVYSTLTWSLVAADPVQSASMMMMFGLGNLPALLSFGLFAQTLTKLKKQPLVRLSLGALIILFGIWTLAGPIMMSTMNTDTSLTSTLPKPPLNTG